MTARAFGRGTPGAVVSAFFTSLFDVAKESPDQSAVLVPHAVGLLSAAASFASRAEPVTAAADALARERVLDFLRRNLADPHLDTATVANACNVSRRTLYRMLGDEGVAARLRRMRIEHAKVRQLLQPGGGFARIYGPEGSNWPSRCPRPRRASSTPT